MVCRFKVSNEDYQKIRHASMRGGFEHEFAITGSTVKVKTRHPQALVKDLEKLIDPGETSWAEILEIK